MAFAKIFLGDLRDRGRGRHLADEHQRRENHSGFDGDRQIREDGQRET